MRTGRAADAVPHLRRGFDAGIELPQGGLDFPLALQATGDTAGALAAIRRLPPPDGDADACLQRRPPGHRVGRAGGRRAVLPSRRRRSRPALGRRRGCSTVSTCWCCIATRPRPGSSAEAVRLDPRDADGLSRLAYCELELGRTADARVHAAAALALNPGDPLAAQLVAAIDKAR